MNKILVLKNGTTVEIVTIRSCDTAPEPAEDVSVVPVVESDVPTTPVVENDVPTEDNEATV